MSLPFSIYPFLLELQNNNVNDILCLKLLPRVVLLYTIDREIFLISKYLHIYSLLCDIYIYGINRSTDYEFYKMKKLNFILPFCKALKEMCDEDDNKLLIGKYSKAKLNRGSIYEDLAYG